MIASSFQLLAFGFGSPGILGWLVLAALPVLIHWLFRRRYREVTWAAMQFLHEAARKQSRRTRLEQLLLLASRVLLLTLVVLAFAQPRWSDAGKLSRSTPPTLRVIVLDASLSMGRRAAEDHPRGATLWECAKSIAREIVDQSQPGDRFALARISGSEPRLLIRQPTLVTSAVIDEVDRLSLTFERGDVAATLRQLPEVLAAKSPNERCQVLVISDFQADNWSVGPAAGFLALEKTTGLLPDEFVLMDVGAAAPENGAVVGLSTEPPILAAGQPMSVSSVIRNRGTAPLIGRRVEWRIDGHVVESRRIDLPVGQETNVEFSLTAPASGEHSLAVKLDDDSLAADNERWLPIQVRSELSVLLVNGRPSARPRDAATFYVEQALAPRIAQSEPPSRWLRVTTVPDSDLPNVELQRFDVLFLCDVGTLTAEDVERLRRFSERGGGVIVSLGPNVSLQRLNELAFGPQGLMALRLEKVLSTSDADDPPAFSFDPGDYSHPLLHEFRGNPSAGLETALMRSYVQVKPLDPARTVNATNRAAPAIALWFSTGDPAIVTQSVGRGQCVLVTTTLDETWGAWPVWGAGFVPLMHELTEFSAAGRTQSREALVGDLIVREVENRLANITLTAPDGSQQTLIPLDRDGQAQVAVLETHRPGIYTLTTETTPVTTERIAINVDPRESDPARIDPRDWISSIGNLPDGRLVVRDVNAPVPPPQTPLDSDSHSLALELLLVVLALLFIEQALAWRFTAGLAVAILSLAVAALWFAIRSF
jgi:hypothetical protein